MTIDEYRSHVRANIGTLSDEELEIAVATIVCGFVWVVTRERPEVAVFQHPSDLSAGLASDECEQVTPTAPAHKQLDAERRPRLSYRFMAGPNDYTRKSNAAAYVETIIEDMDTLHDCGCRIFAGATRGQTLTYLAQFIRYGEPPDAAPTVSHGSLRRALALAALRAIFHYEDPQP